MRLPDDFDEKPGFSPTVVMTVVAVTLFVGIILGVVLFLNNSPRSGGSKPTPQGSAGASAEINNSGTGNLPSGSNLTPGDLSFWDMFPESTTEPVITEAPAEKKEDPSTDGQHTLIKYADGTEEWVLISPKLPKHVYDFTKLVCQSGLMKYYENGKKVSYVGVDISEEQDYVDFAKVKKAGIEFVMLRAGARGYSTGQLILDEYFLDNLKRATNAGLDVGVYFCSQAVTEEEAIEEVNLIVQNLGEYDIDYPIVFQMEKIGNDVARTNSLSRSDKTVIASAFLRAVEDAGYKSMLYGDKEWLIKEIDMSKLTAYDVWLAQQGDIPDYPYNFAMWQYNYKGSVDGIAGYVNLNISFIKYAEK